MIQALRPAGPQYAARVIGSPAGARLARGVQSAGAALLLGDLRAWARVQEGVVSIAHARGWVAAAVAREGRVGIDLEYCTPLRPIGEIAQWLMGSDAPNTAAAWRVFTFYEAYFKAFGEAPSRALMLAVARTQGELTRLPGALGVLHVALAADAVLTLVWTGPDDPQQASL